MSSQMRCLLDKNVVRYTIAGWRYRHLRSLSPLEIGALSFWRLANDREVLIYISDTSFEVLRHLQYREVRFLLNTVDVLSPTRYHTRWTRRIRETTGLTREDAAMIALASFGSNQQGTILGTQRLLTYDQRMINGYLSHLSVLQHRLGAMTAQLLAPFHQAYLPQLVTPDEMIGEWTA